MSEICIYLQQQSTEAYRRQKMAQKINFLQSQIRQLNSCPLSVENVLQHWRYRKKAFELALGENWGSKASPREKWDPTMDWPRN